MKWLNQKEGIVISERKYTLDISKEIGMIDCRPMDSPINLNKNGRIK